MLAPLTALLIAANVQVTVRLDSPDQLVSISVAENAFADLIGQPSAASNTIAVVHDTTGPQTTIRSSTGYTVTDSPSPIIIVDFGERVLGADAADLFTITGIKKCAVSLRLDKSELSNFQASEISSWCAGHARYST